MDHATKMKKAFALVDPYAYAVKMAAKGLCANPETISWKDPIRSWVTEEELTTAGVTLDDVVEAVGYYTATEVRLGEGDGGYLVMAAGYRMGPAGDH